MGGPSEDDTGARWRGRDGWTVRCPRQSSQLLGASGRRCATVAAGIPGPVGDPPEDAAVAASAGAEGGGRGVMQPSDVLISRLSGGPALEGDDLNGAVQVVYSEYVPLFVSKRRFRSLRRVRGLGIKRGNTWETAVVSWGRLRASEATVCICVPRRRDFPAGQYADAPAWLGCLQAASPSRVAFDIRVPDLSEMDDEYELSNAFYRTEMMLLCVCEPRQVPAGLFTTAWQMAVAAGPLQYTFYRAQLNRSSLFT